MKAQAALCIRADSPWPLLYAYTYCESVCKSDQNEKFSLSHSTYTVQQEPIQLAHRKYGQR